MHSKKLQHYVLHHKISPGTLCCLSLLFDTFHCTRFRPRQPRCPRPSHGARSPGPRLHTRRCLDLALPADLTATIGVTAQPARCVATPRLRPSQPRGFTARLSWPTTMPAPTRLHPNPLVCHKPCRLSAAAQPSPQPLPPTNLLPTSHRPTNLLPTRALSMLASMLLRCCHRGVSPPSPTPLCYSPVCATVFSHPGTTR